MRTIFLFLLSVAASTAANPLDQNTLGLIKELKTDEEIGTTLTYITGVSNAWAYMHMSASFHHLRSIGTGDRAAVILSTNLVRQCTKHLDTIALFGLAAREAQKDPDQSLTAFVLETLENELLRCVREQEDLTR